MGPVQGLTGAVFSTHMLDNFYGLGFEISFVRTVNGVMVVETIRFYRMPDSFSY